jgi:autotransporter passenger strand-loop-strand repeat protein
MAAGQTASTTVVSSGQTLSGSTVAGHDTLKVEAGGTIEAIVASGNPGSPIAGPFVTVFGIASGTAVERGAQMSVTQGGQAFDTVVSAGGSVIADGQTDGSTIGSGGYFYGYGVMSGTQVLAGGELDVYATATNTVIHSGGFIELSGLLDGCTVQSGGQIEDYAGGMNFSGVVISAGGVLLALPAIDVSSGSMAVDTEIKSGGTLIDTPGGSIGGLTIDAGAVVIAATDVVFAAANGVVIAAGNDLRGTVLGFGQNETVFAGGVAYATTLASDPVPGAQDTQQLVDSGGRAQGTRVGASGVQSVFGTANATEILSGGQQFLYGGSTMSTVIFAGGVQSSDGATTTSTLVELGGLMQGSFEALDTLISGGTMSIDSGEATDTVIKGGVQQVRGTVKADATQIYAGGEQMLSDRARAYATMVYAGGEQLVAGAQATASATTIARSGVQRVTYGSAASATVASGGTQYVTSFGSAEATTLERGGLLVDTLGDAVVSNLAFLLGGTLDLSTLTFVSGATATVNGADVLTVQDGARSTSLQLVGTYAGERFAVTADDKGGSFVTLSAAQDIGMPMEVAVRTAAPAIMLAAARTTGAGMVAALHADPVQVGIAVHPQ